jgi:MoxR-like ATPase
LGIVDAHGKYHMTPFRRAYEFGGLFLFDEIDGSYPNVLLAFNAALSNGYMDFPDGIVKQHNNFKCVAAANTFGMGADRQYVGRNQLDASSLDRFSFLDWGYDEYLEIGISSNLEWVEYVQKVRKVVNELGLRHIVSMRASIIGSRYIEGGMSWEDVERCVLFKGLGDDKIKQIKSKLGK